jgi:imidazole glycerol-phosphate synthase subunit HisH
MKKKITIVDYGLGNIVSAQQSFLKVIQDNSWHADVIISNNPDDINNSSHIVLPGQGAFKSCMDGLRNISGMIEALEKNVLKKKTPFLGICVGMQLLADESNENGLHNGLGWIHGTIRKIVGNKIKLPHMGWNTLKIQKNSSKMVFKGDTKDFYFVHSYYFECLNEKNIIALTNYGLDFASIVFKENIYGVQFHPEKSSLQGLQLIKNFLSL